MNRLFRASDSKKMERIISDLRDFGIEIDVDLKSGEVLGVNRQNR